MSNFNPSIQQRLNSLSGEDLYIGTQRKEGKQILCIKEKTWFWQTLLGRLVNSCLKRIYQPKNGPIFTKSTLLDAAYIVQKDSMDEITRLTILNKIAIIAKRKFSSSDPVITQQIDTIISTVVKDKSEKIRKEAEDKAQQEAKDKTEQEAAKQKEAEDRAKAEQEAKDKAKAEQEAEDKAQQEAIKQKEAKDRAKAEQEAKDKAEQEAAKQKEAEEQRKRQLEAEKAERERAAKEAEEAKKAAELERAKQKEAGLSKLYSTLANFNQKTENEWNKTSFTQYSSLVHELLEAEKDNIGTSNERARNLSTDFLNKILPKLKLQDCIQNISKQEAEEILKDLPQGSFIVREESLANQGKPFESIVVISYVNQSHTVEHLQFDYDVEQDPLSFTLIQQSSDKEYTLEDLCKEKLLKFPVSSPYCVHQLHAKSFPHALGLPLAFVQNLYSLLLVQEFKKDSQLAFNLNSPEINYYINRTRPVKIADFSSSINSRQEVESKLSGLPSGSFMIYKENPQQNGNLTLSFVDNHKRVVHTQLEPRQNSRFQVEISNQKIIVSDIEDLLNNPPLKYPLIDTDDGYETFRGDFKTKCMTSLADIGNRFKTASEKVSLIFSDEKRKEFRKFFFDWVYDIYQKFLLAFDSDDPTSRSWLSFQKWNDMFQKHGIGLFNFKHLLNSVLASQDLKLAEYFWNVKCTILAHEWGVEDKYQLSNGKDIKTTGYWPVYTHANLAHSIRDFISDHENELEEQGEPKDWLSTYKSDIVQAFKNSPKYMLGPYTDKKACSDEINQRIDQGKPVVIGTGWKGHAVTVVIYKGYLAYVNRGERTGGKAPGITVFKINDINALKTVISNPKTNHWIFNKDGFDSATGQAFLEGNGNNSLQKLADLQEIAQIELKDQKIGNCSVANTKGGFLALLNLIKFDSLGITTPAQARNFKISAAYQKDIKPKYKDFCYHDRLTELRGFLEAQRKLTNGKKLKDSDHFRLLSDIIYKIMSKYEGKDNHLLKQMREEVENHFKNYNYSLNDCVSKLNHDESEMLLRTLPLGSFIFRNSATKSGSKAISYNYLDAGVIRTVHSEIIVRTNAGKEEYVLVMADKSEEVFKSFSDLLKWNALKFPVSPDNKERLSLNARLGHVVRTVEDLTDEELTEERKRFLNFAKEAYSKMRNNPQDQDTINATYKKRYEDEFLSSKKALNFVDYYQEIIRDEAELLLKGLPEGCFVLRSTSLGEGYICVSHISTKGIKKGKMNHLIFARHTTETDRFFDMEVTADGKYKILDTTSTLQEIFQNNGLTTPVWPPQLNEGLLSDEKWAEEKIFPPTPLSPLKEIFKKMGLQTGIEAALQRLTSFYKFLEFSRWNKSTQKQALDNDPDKLKTFLASHFKRNVYQIDKCISAIPLNQHTLIEKWLSEDELTPNGTFLLVQNTNQKIEIYYKNNAKVADKYELEYLQAQNCYKIVGDPQQREIRNLGDLIGIGLFKTDPHMGAQQFSLTYPISVDKIELHTQKNAYFVPFVAGPVTP